MIIGTENDISCKIKTVSTCVNKYDIPRIQQIQTIEKVQSDQYFKLIPPDKTYNSYTSLDTYDSYDSPNYYGQQYKILKQNLY